MVNYEQNESPVDVYLSRLTTEGASRGGGVGSSPSIFLYKIQVKE